METESFAEGLFLKNYLGTVSTVPKSRSPNQSDTRFSVNSFCNEEYRTCPSHSVKDRMPDSSKASQYLRGKNANELDIYKTAYNGPDSQNNFIRRNMMTYLNQPENEKKKGKKWTLGVLFRKKCKKNAEDNTDESVEEDVKKNYVSRPKCKKKKIKSKVRSTSNGFDMIIPPKKEEIQANKYEDSHKSQENDSNIIYQKSVGNSAILKSDTPTRFIHRHTNNFSEDEKIKCSKVCLQVSKNIRKNSNVTHNSSVNGENTEGRKCRKKVLARAEAKRDMICDDSSSEEYESFHSNSSLNKNNVDQLGARKLRRNKRLSRNGSYSPKSSGDLAFEKENDLTLVRSDVQESIEFNPSLYRNRLSHSVDQVDKNLSTKNHSKTVSAMTNHSQIHRTIDPMESCQANTLPFVHSLRKSQNSYTNFSNLPVENRVVSVTQNQSCISHSQENQSFISNMQSTGSLNATVNSENTKLSGTDPSFSASTREKNWLSMDVCKTNFFKNCDTEIFLDQLLNEYNQVNQITINSLPKSRLPLLNFEQPEEELEIFGKKTNEYEIEDDFYFFSNMPSTYKSRIKSEENKASPYVSTPISNITNQLTKTLQRSGSEYFFDDSQFPGNFERNHSISYQNIPTCTHIQNKNRNKENETQTQNKMFSTNPNLHSFESQKGFSPMSNNLSSENCVKDSASILRYYADLNPRSRNPIHISCYPAVVSHEPLFNCTQVANKPKDSYFSRQTEFSESTILKAKDQEVQLRDFAMQQENFQDSYRLCKRNGNSKLNRSRSNGLKSGKVTNAFNQPFAHSVYNIYESQNQFKNFCVKHDDRENFKDETKLFEPPIHTLTQQEILIPVNKNKHFESENIKISRETEFKNCSSYLSDALNELENIYNGLKDKDSAIESMSCEKTYLSGENLRDFNKKREESLDSKSENLAGEKEFFNFPQKESNLTLCVNKPDKIYDDMAFRRMNVKDRSNPKTFISPSYLRFSFTSPQLKAESPIFQKKSSTYLKEPDITYDDVVFRNIRRANNTLKVLDPQPPFGIPIGIFTPSPCSNYLDAVPKERFRSTFTSSKTPDIVKDDLAFRNLRKDNKSVINLPRKEFSKSGANLLKKRAVRSLSANISNIIHTKDSLGESFQTIDSVGIKKKEEKSTSLTNLTKGYLHEKEISAKRLKEVNEKNNEFFERFAEIKNKIGGNKRESLNYFKQSKSTEEIKYFDLNTSSVVNKSNNSNSIKKSQFVFSPKRHTAESMDKKGTRSPVVALSKYPAAAPISENIGRKNSFDFFYNENQLENLLAVLNDEFTVNDSERRLNNLEWKPVSENKTISTATEKFNKKFKADSLEKVKRRRNLSLSNLNESKIDDNWGVRSSSLERRKRPTKKDESLLHFDDLSKSTKNVNGVPFKEKESNSMGASKNLEETLNEEALKEEIIGYNANQSRASAAKNEFTSDSLIKLSTKELKLNSPLELESKKLCSADVNECVKMEKPVTVFVKEEVPFELGDTFQEVYEYKCQLTDKRDSELGNMLIGNKNEKSTAPIEASNYKFEGNSLSDVVQEFEKLHKEQSNCTKNTKENKVQLNEFADRESLKESSLFLSLSSKRCNSLKLKNRGGTSEFSSKGEGYAYLLQPSQKL